MTIAAPLNFESSDAAKAWRGSFENSEVNALHAQCFQHPVGDEDWWTKLNRFSLGWVCCRHSGKLIGFVNVAWDGGSHAFVLDTMVSPHFQRRGIAKMLIEIVVEKSKEAGCEWLHVDFETRLKPFYLETCGFRYSDAGVFRLN